MTTETITIVATNPDSIAVGETAYIVDVQYLGNGGDRGPGALVRRAQREPLRREDGSEMHRGSRGAYNYLHTARGLGRVVEIRGSLAVIDTTPPPGAEAAFSRSENADAWGEPSPLPDYARVVITGPAGACVTTVAVARTLE